MSRRRTALTLQRDNTPVVSSSGNSTPGTGTEADDTDPAVIESPVKRRRKKTKTLNDKSDLEVWDLDDDEIIGECSISSLVHFCACYLMSQQQHQEPSGDRRPMLISTF